MIYYPVPENSYLRNCIESEITELPDLISWCDAGIFDPSVVQIDFNIISHIGIINSFESNPSMQFAISSDIDFDIDTSMIILDFDDQGYNYWGVFADSNFVYAACVGDGLLTYSVDGSGILTLIDEDDQGGLYWDVWGDGNFVYAVCGDDGLRSYSVDGGGNLTYIDVDLQIGHSNDPGYVADYLKVWGDGNFIYIGNSYNGLASYSVDGAGILTFIDKKDNGGTGGWGGTEFKGVWGDGNFVYVATSQRGFRVYSVDGVGNLTFKHEKDFGTHVYDVWGDGNFLYAGTANGLYSFSINPTTGVATQIDQHIEGFGKYIGVWGDGTAIYISVEGSSPNPGLYRYTVDGAGNLTFVDKTFDFGTSWAYKDVHGDGNFVYIAAGINGVASYLPTPIP